mmetsp:Transcript_37094/g.54527  ORF Transcript_37094/g.54527 Transcript_37094/m.54527 type:complete len:325 (+) Transcript_37094:60-1034(+)|eukprot:CAMPEP_0195516724 /NCGR_PEP_ID=MMETSP0794_2-20130614/8302_1 /TAXON_ID=515487 /ORGANISM="Stephanopyxis turris, Strain CCMP 815" /LENGTH=324 /DNA_ID=CAMNT_0040645385 /DNA_START=56 /DNA_END=1030 /DNA_ORIENTATION=+
MEEEQEKQSFLKRTRAYGKLILFGEHFVVYKVPALVGAVSAYTDCEVQVIDDGSSSGKLEVEDNRPAVPNYKVKKAEEGRKAIQLVLDHLKVDESKQRNMKLVFGGDLCCVSGIGASAAQVVALARGLGLKLDIPMSDDEINAAGYEGEKGYHGTPSGIDNTAATFRGVLKFQRTETEPLFQKTPLNQPIRIVYASTGITSSTTEVVGDVRSKKEADEEWFAALLAKYVTVLERGEEAIRVGDMKALGELMDENHVLLQELTVSCKELDDLVQAARGAGAYGAKMSGTGRGGLIIALTPTEELQNTVADALEKIAPIVWKTTFA